MHDNDAIALFWVPTLGHFLDYSENSFWNTEA